MTGNHPQGFWADLRRPFFSLAPLADVTDAAFRRVIAKYGKPDVMFTEFTSADGLMLADESGRAQLLKNLEYTEAERPIVAQLFGAIPEHMEHAAALARKLGFDGVDINMGCPDKSIEKQGAGAAMIRTPELAIEVLKAARRGAGGLPVSVKTRIGYSRAEEFEPWMEALLSAAPAALTLHARTRREMSKVPARWDYVKRLVELRNEMNVPTLILGNGDAWSLADAREKAAESGVDGVMLGRAIFGNPWLFQHSQECWNVSITERLQVMLEHTKAFEEILGQHKPLHIMKKHYKAYINGFEGAKELRMRLMEAESVQEIENIVQEELSQASTSPTA